MTRAGREPVYWLVIRLLDWYVRARFRLDLRDGTNVPSAGPALLAANHVAEIDSIVLIVACHRLGRRVRFLGVREAFEHPVAGPLLRAGRHIPVDQGGRNLAAFRAAGEALARGDLVLVYPEGTIPRVGAATDPRAGAALLALRHDVPVVPIALEGTQRAPRRVRRCRVGVAVGEPVRVAREDGETTRAACDRATGELLAAVRAAHRTAAARV